jgi:hypothetical protein
MFADDTEGLEALARVAAANEEWEICDITGKVGV